MQNMSNMQMPRVGPGGQPMPGNMPPGGMVGNQMGMGGMGPMGQQNPVGAGIGGMPGQMSTGGPMGQMNNMGNVPNPQMMNNMVPISINSQGGMPQNQMNVRLLFVCHLIL